jgi:hypothetical protein
MIERRASPLQPAVRAASAGWREPYVGKGSLSLRSVSGFAPEDIILMNKIPFF